MLMVFAFQNYSYRQIASVLDEDCNSQLDYWGPFTSRLGEGTLRDCSEWNFFFLNALSMLSREWQEEEKGWWRVRTATYWWKFLCQTDVILPSFGRTFVSFPPPTPFFALLLVCFTALILTLIFSTVFMCMRELILYEQIKRCVLVFRSLLGQSLFLMARIER